MYLADLIATNVFIHRIDVFHDCLIDILVYPRNLSSLGVKKLSCGISVY